MATERELPQAPPFFGDLKRERPPARAWMENGTIFVAMNHADRRTIPPYIRTQGRPTQLTRAEWIRDGYIYMSFLPLNLDFSKALVQRLNVDMDRMPLANIPLNTVPYYKLDRTVTDSWRRLAKALVDVVNVLLPLTGLVTNIRLPPRPKCWELEHSVDSEEKYKKKAMEVKAAFLPWLALVSFCIAALEKPKEFTMAQGVKEYHSTWVGELLCAGVHPGWVGMLVDSQLSQFASTRRLGTMIHFEKDFYALFISFLADHSVPVIYCLDADNDSGLPEPGKREEYLSWYRDQFDRRGTQDDMAKFLRKLIPPAHVVERNISFEDAEQHPIEEDHSFLATPALDPSSGQTMFESRAEFFLRRDKENAELISRETPDEKQRRENRIRDAASLQPPGKGNKATVYEWETVGEWEIRRKQNRSWYERLFFHLHSKDEIKYDAVRNEWDLWSNSRKQKATVDEEESKTSDDEDDANEPDFPSIDPRLYEEDLCYESGCVPSEDIPRGLRTSQAINRSNTVPLSTMLRAWYGFTFRTSTSINTELDANRSKNSKAVWNDLSKPNRLKAVLVDSVSGEMEDEAAVRLSVFRLLAERDGSSSPLTDLDHLHLRHTRVRIWSTKYSARHINYSKAKTTKLYGVQLVDGRGAPVEDRDHRRLFFWDAKTAVSVLRLQLPDARTISHVADFLLRLGASFLMTIPRRFVRPSYQDVRVSSLGRRWRGYKPDKGDLAVYHQKCKELFSIRRVRRALRCGGILWRIAKDFIPVAEALDGPLYEATNEPLWVQNSETGRDEYIEDGLSLEEVHILIGSFELRDAKSNNESVTASYWPPPWIWDSSGYHVGYWTPDCEDWFVNRQEKMLDGSKADSLLGVEEWKRALQRFRATKKLSNALEDECERYIKGLRV